MNYKIFYLHQKHKHKKRKILTYVDDDKLNLKKKHTTIKNWLEINTAPSDFAYAYTKKKSIYQNAAVHKYNDYFLKMDINSFFESINLNMLSKLLKSELKKTMKVSTSYIHELVETCSVYKKGVPIGLVTSPILGNLYLKQFDGVFYSKLKKIKKEKNLNRILYTRYADDLTISFRFQKQVSKTEYDLKEIKNEIINIAKSLLRKYFLKLNPHKTKFIDFNKSNHVRITGISITKNSKNKRELSVGRKKIRQLYIDAIALHHKKRRNELTSDDILKVKQVKGMNSFILSIKRNPDFIFSDKMKKIISKFGFKNLADLINDL